MEQTIDHNSALGSDTSALTSRVEYQAYQILRIGFTVAPILAGLDKFTHFLTDWDKYLPPVVNNLLGGHGHDPSSRDRLALRSDHPF